MKFNKQQRRAHNQRRGPATLYPDPDLFFGDDAHARHKPDYKTHALCKQVLRIVSCALAGECGDPILQDLRVDAVLPAPNAGRLMVMLRAGALAGGRPMADVLTRLDQVHSMLRARVAQAIVRKRAPELAFQVFGCGVPS